MKFMRVFLLLLAIIYSTLAQAYECATIYDRKDERRADLNLPTLKALELQEYDNPHMDKHYYPFPLNKAQSQKYLTQLLAENPASAFHPTVFLSAIAACDETTIQRYIQHGLTLYCYNQEDSSNILSGFQHCRPPRMSDLARDQTMKMVLQAGANPNEGKKGLERDAAGVYPLTIAIERCDVRMLNMLLKYQANPNLKTTGERYFPILNICGPNRNYSHVETPPELDYPPTPTLPLGQMMQSLLEHGADPNTVYITDDQRNYATQDREKILQLACSGKDEKAKTVYDLYAKELAEAKTVGDPIQISNFQKLWDVLVKYEAKPLTELCKTGLKK